MDLIAEGELFLRGVISIMQRCRQSTYELWGGGGGGGEVDEIKGYIWMRGGLDEIKLHMDAGPDEISK